MTPHKITPQIQLNIHYDHPLLNKQVKENQGKEPRGLLQKNHYLQKHQDQQGSDPEIDLTIPSPKNIIGQRASMINRKTKISQPNKTPLKCPKRKGGDHPKKNKVNIHGQNSHLLFPLILSISTLLSHLF